MEDRSVTTTASEGLIPSDDPNRGLRFRKLHARFVNEMWKARAGRLETDAMPALSPCAHPPCICIWAMVVDRYRLPHNVAFSVDARSSARARRTLELHSQDLGRPNDLVRRRRCLAAVCREIRDPAILGWKAAPSGARWPEQ